MIYDELNQHIMNYIKSDITGRAIMLTGEWGSGKSFYVKNTLKPFLESPNGGNHKCAIVSLYGLTDISEISKAIYLELRTLKKDADAEAGNMARVVGKIVGKTIFNGLINKIGFDVGSINEDDLKKVYESIDLSDKLIVLEDIERTKIDIIELLGYINNMCEHDGAKVLLVTNEDENLTMYEGTDKQGKATRLYTDKAREYIKSKEKTVGDTMYFVCDYKNTIQQIISTFVIYMKIFQNQEAVEEIHFIFTTLRSHNLRSFILACQKSKDLFAYAENNHIYLNEEIKKIVFYGIVSFCQRRGNGTDLQFARNMYLSAELGFNNEYPLFCFCFDYIVYQFLSKDEIIKANTYFNEYRRSGKWNSRKDSDMKIINGFHKRTEKEVKNAIMSIPQKLQNGCIPYCDYGILLNYLIAIKCEVGIDFDIDTIVDIIISDLRNNRDNISFESLFNSQYTLHSEVAIESFNAIKEKMRDALESSEEPQFTYSPERIEEFYDQNHKKLRDNIHSKGFACTLDFELFLDFMKKCSSAQISTIRSLFLSIYSSHHYSQILADDLSALNKLKDGLATLKEYEGYDKIQKFQMFWFRENIAEILLEFDNQKTQGDQDKDH